MLNLGSRSKWAVLGLEVLPSLFFIELLCTIFVPRPEFSYICGSSWDFVVFILLVE